MALPARGDVVALPARRGTVRAAVVALRPRQWVKNGLLFAGIVFAERLDDPTRWLEATAAFVAYCAASSAAYLINDVVDAPQDRAHPNKRVRPIARRELSSRAAVALAAVLATASVALAALLGLGSLALLAGFLALQAAYSYGLKRVALVDVMAIAALFGIRAAAGAEAVRVPISPWLLLCSMLLALYLALGKRRAELRLVGGSQIRGRPVLEQYSASVLDQLLTVAAAGTIVSYSLYTVLGRDSMAFMVTIPLVVFGVFRYLMLIQRRELGEEPEEILLRDRPIIVAIALWVLAAVVVPLLV
jgi:4-hydroxybenzoate polyprenyltransferase